MSYAAIVLADSPDLYWRLDETSGTAVLDATANNHDGNSLNSPTLGATGLLTGDSNTCYDFDGTNDSVGIAGLPSGYAPPNSFSAEAWFNADVLASAGTIVNQSSSIQVSWSVIQVGDDLYFSTNTNGTTGWQDLVASNVLAANTTYHVVATYDHSNGEKKLYLDGTLVASTTGQFRHINTGLGVNAGAWPNATQPFNGRIDEVAFYPSILTSTQVADHYTAGITGETNVAGALATETDEALTGAVSVLTSGSLATEVDTALSGVLVETPLVVALQLHVDADDPTDIFSSAVSIIVRRGLTADGVLERLEPGVCTVVFADDTLNPLTYEPTRPGRPLRLFLGIEGHPDADIFTGTIDRSELEIDKDTGRQRLVLRAIDAVKDLVNAPYTTAHAGTFSQRVTPVLDAAGVAYDVHDDDPDETPGTLPTDQTTALGQLLLARDTMHGFVYVDSSNVVQAWSDDQRDRLPAGVTFTDGSVAGLDYVDIAPGFDTDDLVNVLTVRTLDTPDPTEDTFTDEASVTEWGIHPQTVTVNEGDPETHWLRFSARLAGAGITAEWVRFNAAKIDAFLPAAALELYQSVRVVRDGLIDQEQQVIHLEHTITPHRVPEPIKWMVTLTTRKRELLPLRWMDVPPEITWADLDPDMTWNTAIYWHP